MKNSKILPALMTIFILLTCKAFAQEEDLIYKVTNCKANGVNCDQLALEGDIALIFYFCDEGETLCFANHWRNNDSQSFGRTYAFKTKKHDANENTYAIDEFKFTWKFINTYDDIRGEAVVTFSKIYIGSTIKFVAEILDLNTNNLVIYSGYLE